MQEERPDIGQQYDKLAAWWHRQHVQSEYGVAQVQRALGFTAKGGAALDVGCGAGGRLVHLMEKADFSVLGIDTSAEMISLAQTNHPAGSFAQADVAQWESTTHFDFILAWDCLFHLPLDAQEPVLAKLCRLLSDGGVMIHTFGDAVGEHTDTWHGQDFRYSSVGIAENLKILQENGASLLHLELDQWPEKHVYAISQKR